MTSPYTTLFITENDIKTVFTTLQQNVDSSLIVPNLQRAQEMFIEHRLGNALTNKIKSEIEASTLVDPYRTLVESYIAPALAFYALFLSIPDLHIKLTAKGALLKTSENSSSASLEELSWLRADKRDTADFYLNRMINYLKDNKSNFPEYSPDIVNVNKNTFKSGIIIPKRYGSKNNITCKSNCNCSKCR
jgi:hypothetical protein